MIKIRKKVKVDVVCFDSIYWFVLVLWCDAFVLIVFSNKPWQNQGRELVDRKLVKAPTPVFLLLAVPRRSSVLVL